MRLLLSFLLITFSLPAMATETLKVGGRIPTDLALMNQKSTATNFKELAGENGLVLFFIRSADWCPYCQVQLLDLRKGEADPIIDAGYNIAIISYDAPEKLTKFATRYSFDFPMLSDQNSETIKAFGILNEDFAPDHFAYGVPHPHIYVVNKDKTIKAVLSEEGYKRRPEIADVVDALK